jgi:gamma-glutamyltranspeptidase/glutathione hydrolase
MPGFVTRNGNGRPLLSFGVMGGHMQPQGHLQMMVRIFDHGLNPQAASDAPRWQVTEENALYLEPGFPTTTCQGLEDRGHRILRGHPFWGYGGAQLLHRLGRGYAAASDHRKDGQAVGY